MRFAVASLTSISTHSPRVGRTSYTHSISSILAISTHSPRVGRTRRGCRIPQFFVTFQLTRPVWGEPRPTAAASVAACISTHSPRVGRTYTDFNKVFVCTNFNSLAPCGANRLIPWTCRQSIKFQLTRPVWGEPTILYNTLPQKIFQLTRPVWGEPSGTGQRDGT